MSEGKTMRLNKVLRELNISLDRAVEHLAKSGHEIDARPTTKISGAEYQVLLDGFQTDASKKAASKEVGEEKRKEKEAIRLAHEAKAEQKRLEEEEKREVLKAKAEKLEIKTVGKIDIDKKPKVEEKKEVVKEETPKEEPVKDEVSKVDVPKKEEVKKEIPVSQEKTVDTPIEKAVAKVEKKIATSKQDTPKDEITTAEDAEVIETKYKKLDGPNFTGKKIDLKQFEKPKKKKPEAKTDDKSSDAKKKRRRIRKPGGGTSTGGSKPGNNRGPRSARGSRNVRPAVKKEEPTEAEIQKQVRETLEKLQGKSSRGKGAKYRRNKRRQKKK